LDILYANTILFLLKLLVKFLLTLLTIYVIINTENLPQRISHRESPVW